MNVTLAAYQDILYCSRPVSRHPKSEYREPGQALYSFFCPSRL